MSMLNYHGHTFGRSHTLEVHKPQVALMCVSFDFYHIKNYWEMLSKITHSYIQQIFTEYTQTSQAQYQMLETVQWEKMWLLFLWGLWSRKGDIIKKQLEKVWELLWRLVRWHRGKESACQCRRCKRCGFDPLGQEGYREWEMATCTSILAWKIPWTEEPGGLWSMGSQRVGHNLGTKQQHILQ